MRTESDREFLSEKAAAGLLNVSWPHLRNLRRGGQVPYCRIGRRVVYHVPTLRAWALGRMRGGSGSPQMSDRARAE